MITGVITKDRLVKYDPEFLLSIDEIGSAEMTGIIESIAADSGMITVRWFGGGRSIVLPSRLINKD